MNETHNPDVLSCLANLSNDEVFTPPSVVNQMLDMLPQELFRSGKTTFLDIGCKSGVFLREITKRLIAGLANEMPDLQTRVDHILHKQVFGIATTELTSLVSRRTLYCSKYPNCRYSASQFKTVEGNIRFRNIPHTFVNGRCKWCGASEDQFGAKVRKGLETHAYEFIHTDHPEEIFKMKFDVIVGNPPYQLNVGVEKENYAIAIYDKFVIQAKKLMPRYLTMIIPSRWFTGGRGLNEFRESMLTDGRNRVIVDYPDSTECFPGVDIAGGISYFLWSREYQGTCRFVSYFRGNRTEQERCLNEFDVFPRYNEAMPILRKVRDAGERRMSEVVSTQTPFGFVSTFKGKDKKFVGSLRLVGSKGDSYVSRSDVTRCVDIIDTFKLIISKATSEHAGIPDKDGRYKVISTNEIIGKTDVCTQSYLCVYTSKTRDEVVNAWTYLKTRFFRFLLLMGLTSQDLSREKFQFVPMQDFSKPWTDAELYAKYKLTKDEIAFIESMIKPME